MMKKLLIESHFLGSMEYFSLLVKAEEVCFEVCDSFPKQTFRNRAYILGSNKVLPLIVPLKYSNGTVSKDIKVDYSQRWIKDHWGAFYSSYGKAPFFEYFAEEFRAIWEHGFEFLTDLNFKMLELCLKVLKVDPKISQTKEYYHEYDMEVDDFRNMVHPKKPFFDRKIYQPRPYTQLFGDIFVPNLSIVDVVMCEGPLAREYC